MPQSQKTLEFLQKLKDKGHWNDDYDYSEVEYINSYTPINLIDKKLNTKHRQKPSKILLRGVSLGFVNAVDKKSYIIKFLKENGLYNSNQDFSLFDVKKSKEKGIVINKEFSTQHLLNFESLKIKTKCGIKNAVDKNKFVIKEFKKKNGDIYSYENVQYKDDETYVLVTCKTHSDFPITPTHHKQGKGCPKCKGRVKDVMDILPELKKATNNEYDFIGLKDIKTQKQKMNVLYKKYNTIHRISPEKILNAGTKVAIRNAIDKNEFVKCQFREIHGEMYDYSQVNYKNEKTDIAIICKIHNVFYLTPNEHKRGRSDKNRGGCPICSSGWNTERVINFINDLRNEDILKMDPVELNMLIAQGKLPKEFEELVFTLEGTKENSLKTLKEKLGIEEEEEEE